MASNRRRLEKESADDCRSERFKSLTDEPAAADALARGAGEVIIQTLQRLLEPIFVPLFTPLIRKLVREEIGLTQQKHELLTCMKEDLTNKASTSVPKRLKLQFRNKISLPVFTGKRLLGENETMIEIALVDALTGEIVNTGALTTAKLKIVGFRVGDIDGNDDSWTFEDFQNMILSEKKGKRILQGNTCLQLNGGVCFVDKLSFTHNSENTKNGWYRLGVGVVDAALMKEVEVARTEAFLMKDRRATYSDKHPYPSLSDKVCHLQQISYKGHRYKRLRAAKVNTVKDLLTLLYTDQKRLEDILELKASSKIWYDIVNNAQKSNGMFLYLDPSNEQNPGIVLDVKRQLKGLIEETQRYIPVDQLSDKHKVDNQHIVKFASEHFKMLRSFEDETSLEKYLHTDIGFSSTPSANQSLGTSKMIDGSTSPSSQVNCSSPGLNEAPDNLNNSNLHIDQNTSQAPILISQSERGKETVPFDDDVNCYQGGISYHPLNQESPNGRNFGAATERHAHNYTEPGTSQAVESSLNTCGNMNNFNDSFPDSLINDSNLMEEIRHFLYSECLSEPAHSDTDVMMMAQTVSICTFDRARTRWIKVSKLLRRKSVRERITPTEGIQALKKQRCC